MIWAPSNHTAIAREHAVMTDFLAVRGQDGCNTARHGRLFRDEEDIPHGTSSSFTSLGLDENDCITSASS